MKAVCNFLWRRRSPASMPRFRRILPATRGLIAAPWTPLASLCSAWGQCLFAVSGAAVTVDACVSLSLTTGSRVEGRHAYHPKEIAYE
jgi:hypothetical protein